MDKNADTLDQELDDALEMTFPASDPVAVVAPGSTSPVADAPPDRADRVAAERTDVARRDRLKR